MFAKVICSREGCQETLHENTLRIESYFGKLVGCKKIYSAASLQSYHLWLWLRDDRSGVQTDQRHSQQGSASSAKDLLWNEGNKCFFSTSGMLSLELCRKKLMANRGSQVYRIKNESDKDHFRLQELQVSRSTLSWKKEVRQPHTRKSSPFFQQERTLRRYRRGNLRCPFLRTFTV